VSAGDSARLICQWDPNSSLDMSDTSLLEREQVECAYCKDSKPASETTWFMAEPGEKSVRLCDFCYEEARKQLRLLRIVRNRGDYPIEAAS
jgi:hypothetical protein